VKQSRKFYKQIWDIRKGCQPRIDFCKDENGNLLGNRKDILERWVRYFNEILNRREEDGPGNKRNQ
jgi:hypothetical protein